MSLSKHKVMPSYDFPDEILSEVFKRLPVKYVLRCGAVQKSWYHLIKSPIFISLHFNHQKMTAHVNPKYLLFEDTSFHTMTICSDDAHCQEYCTFDYPLDLPFCSWYAQSNGLFCMSAMFDQGFTYSPDIFIWNPLVQKYKTVPDSPLSRFTNKEKETRWNALAFGFLPELDDYVVLHIVKLGLTSEPHSFGYMDFDPPLAYEQYPHSVIIGVYSLNSNSWREICQDNVFVDYMCTDHPVFVNGTAYWVGFSSNQLNELIMCFDTKTNILQKITLPNWYSHYERHLGSPLILPFGQSIAYFVEVDEHDAQDDHKDGYPHLDIWVLKVKADRIGEFSWEKQINVRLSDRAEVLGIRNNGDPVLAESNNLISYDLDTHEPYDFVTSCDHLTSYSYYKETFKAPFVIRPFVETLLFLDID